LSKPEGTYLINLRRMYVITARVNVLGRRHSNLFRMIQKETPPTTRKKVPSEPSEGQPEGKVLVSAPEAT